MHVPERLSHDPIFVGLYVIYSVLNLTVNFQLLDKP